MRTLCTAIAAAALCLGTQACGLTTSEGPVSGPMAAEAPRTMVEVTSRNSASVNVFLHAGGMRYRLGTVRPMQSASFAVPRSAHLVAGNVHLVVDPIGSDDVFVTDRIRVRPGQQIAFTVQARLPISSYMVMDR